MKLFIPIAIVVAVVFSCTHSNHEYVKTIDDCCAEKTEFINTSFSTDDGFCVIGERIRKDNIVSKAIIRINNADIKNATGRWHEGWVLNTDRMIYIYSVVRFDKDSKVIKDPLSF